MTILNLFCKGGTQTHTKAMNVKEKEKKIDFLPIILKTIIIRKTNQTDF
jgi:hypothetical protein